MNTLLEALRLHLLVSLPQAFFTWLFVFSFLRPLPNKTVKRVLILAVIHSIYTDSLLIFVPQIVHVINTFAALAILIFLIFKELELRKKLFIFFGTIIASTVCDFTAAIIASFFGYTELDSLRGENLSVLVTIVYPQLTVLAICSWFVRRKASKTAVKLFSLNIKENRTLLRILALIITQFIVLTFMFTIRYSDIYIDPLVTTILIYLTVLFVFAAIALTVRLLTTTKSEAIRSTQELYVDDINDMFTTVRGQRHDFLNHVQVIHSMARMGRLEQLITYTATLAEETREVNEIVNHDSPALAAFAQAKTTVALSFGIPFECKLPSEWNVSESAISTLDIIKILGNLVDNAFDETSLLPEEERAVNVSIQLSDNKIILEVSNRGKEIADATRAIIFQSGYSTKSGNHSGLGLAIVRERVDRYNGQLTIDWNQENQMTTFRIAIPYAGTNAASTA